MFTYLQKLIQQVLDFLKDGKVIEIQLRKSKSETSDRKIVVHSKLLLFWLLVALLTIYFLS